MNIVRTSNIFASNNTKALGLFKKGNFFMLNEVNSSNKDKHVKAESFHPSVEMF